MRWLRLPLATALLAAAATLAGAADVPRRVASINLSADEILVEILPPGRLVGVTRFADEPGTSNVVGRVPPSVFRFQKADMERLVALAPDLVVVSEYTDADFLKLVERSGMRWHRMEGLESIAACDKPSSTWGASWARRRPRAASWRGTTRRSPS
jgi:ABC-type hemin transport system substrate-binding protein